jgi:hypothetical protein
MTLSLLADTWSKVGEKLISPWDDHSRTVNGAGDESPVSELIIGANSIFCCLRARSERTSQCALGRPPLNDPHFGADSEKGD